MPDFFFFIEKMANLWAQKDRNKVEKDLEWSISTTACAYLPSS